VKKNCLSWALVVPALISAAFIDQVSAQVEIATSDAATSSDASGLKSDLASFQGSDDTNSLTELPLSTLNQVAQVPATEPPADPAAELPSEAQQTQHPDASSARPTLRMSQVTSVNQLSSQPDSALNQTMSQLTSVTQLSDVQPTDWAYQALQSLVERYGCIVGYPDGTYKGQRALTRFEFAAGMNACLDRISELLAASTADLATKEDLATLQRLQEEFATELAALRGRVDVLDARVADLEANQFSTTTKLSGETLFFVSDIFNEEDEDPDEEFDNVTVFQHRSRLIFDTSFVGTDQLRARLQAGTLQPFDQPGFDLGFGAFGNTDDSFQMDLLSYQFAVGDIARVSLFANGGGLDDATFGNTINPLDNPARSAITRFGQRNPSYRTAQTSAGASLNLFLSKDISLQAAYLSGESSNPAAGAGLLNGNYGALGQITFRSIFDVMDLAFTYVNAYTGTSSNADGSVTAGVPFGLGSRFARVDVDRPVIANSYGVEANFKIFDGLQLGGWAGYSAVRAIGLGDANVWTYAGTLALPDLFGKGNLGGLIVGMQPRLTGSDQAIGDILGDRDDPDVGLHVEAFYRWAISDNIDVTPGFVWVTAPNHDEENDDLFMGVLRTTFRF
jgi:hypothetical protein